MLFKSWAEMGHCQPGETASPAPPRRKFITEVERRIILYEEGAQPHAGGWLEWSVCLEKTLLEHLLEPEKTVTTDKSVFRWKKEKFATSAHEQHESAVLQGKVQ